MDRQPVRRGRGPHGDGGERRTLHRDVGRARRQFHADPRGILRRHGHLHACRTLDGGRRAPLDHATVRRRRLGLAAIPGGRRQAGRTVHRRSGERPDRRRGRQPGWHRGLLLQLPRERPQQSDDRPAPAARSRAIPARLPLRRDRWRHQHLHRWRDRVELLARWRQPGLPRGRQGFRYESPRIEAQLLPARWPGDGHGGLSVGRSHDRIRRPARAAGPEGQERLGRNPGSSGRGHRPCRSRWQDPRDASPRQPAGPGGPRRSALQPARGCERLRGQFPAVEERTARWRVAAGHRPAGRRAGRPRRRWLRPHLRQRASRQPRPPVQRRWQAPAQLRPARQPASGDL